VKKRTKKRPRKAALQNYFIFLSPPRPAPLSSHLPSAPTAPPSNPKMAESETKSKLPVQVSKPTPYTFDLGLLCASDPNPLQLSSKDRLEEELAATARDGAQVLLNQLLSTCPIASTPAGVLLSLPGISTPLPREKVCYSTLLYSFLLLSSPPFGGKLERERERERERDADRRPSHSRRPKP